MSSRKKAYKCLIQISGLTRLTTAFKWKRIISFKGLFGIKASPLFQTRKRNTDQRNAKLQRHFTAPHVRKTIDLPAYVEKGPSRFRGAHAGKFESESEGGMRNIYTFFDRIVRPSVVSLSNGEEEAQFSVLECASKRPVAKVR